MNALKGTLFFAPEYSVMNDEEFTLRIKQGHIKGNLNSDGTWYITEFYIYKKYRKQGFGKRLASLLPPTCDLIASPLDTGPECLEQRELMAFYEKFGFVFDGTSGKRNWSKKIRNIPIRPKEKLRKFRKNNIYDKLQGL
jgi:GNAT superfamily N-acetyltransferase